MQKGMKCINFEIFLFQNYRNLFRGSLLKCGRKIWASNFVLKVLWELKRSEKIDPTFVLLIAFLKLTPNLNLYSLKLGATTKLIPVPISLHRQFTFAVKWLVKFVRDKRRLVTSYELGDLLLSALEHKGESWYQKKKFYDIALENRYLALKYFA